LKLRATDFKELIGDYDATKRALERAASRRTLVNRRRQPATAGI